MPVKLPKSTGKQIVRGASFLILLVVPIVFGVMGKTAEAALVIVSAAMALVFSDIDRFASFKGAGFAADLRDMRVKVDAVTEKQTEPSDAKAQDEEQDEAGATPLEDTSDSEAEVVLGALGSPAYTWRYMSGLNKETKLPEYKLRRALSWLVSHGQARVSEGKHGLIWSITEKGREQRMQRVADSFEVVHEQPAARSP